MVETAKGVRAADALVFLRGPNGSKSGLARRPSHGAPTEQMDVNVIDRLSAVFPCIDHGAKTLRQTPGTSDFSGYPMKMANERAVLLARVTH